MGTAVSFEERQQCFVCWEDGTFAKPIHRDCGCRGSAGWAHVQCLVGTARARGGRDRQRWWTTCNQCRQRYTGGTREALLRAKADEDRPRTRRRWLAVTLRLAVKSISLLAFCFSAIVVLSEMICTAKALSSPGFDQKVCFGPAFCVLRCAKDPTATPFDVPDIKEMMRKKRAEQRGEDEESSEEEVEMSEYEQMRAARVARNQERLKMLGLA
jgi:hypothetical protein